MSRCFVLKSWLGSAGLAVGLFGMATAQRWPVWIAVVLLGVAFLLRVVERRREPATPDSS